MSTLVDPTLPFQIQLALLPKGVTRDKQNKVFCQYSLMISFFVPTPNPPPSTPPAPLPIDHPYDPVNAAFEKVRQVLPNLMWARVLTGGNLPPPPPLFPADRTGIPGLFNDKQKALWRHLLQD